MQLKKLKDGKHAWRGLLVLFLLGAITLAVMLLTVAWLSVPFVQKNRAMLLTLSFVTVFLSVSAGSIFLIQGKTALYKSIISALALGVFFSLILLIAEWTDFITILGSETLYEEFLEKTGAWMPIIYILLHVVQVLVLPIPGIFSILVGVRLFGAALTALYSYIGILLGSFIAFFIGRKLGVRAVAWLIGAESLEKWRTKIKGKDKLVLTFMFLLPLFPDDILCFVSGVSTMSTKFFVWMVLITRAISVLGSCYTVEWIPLNTWWGLLIWGALAVAALAAFILLYKNIDKINRFLRKKRKR